MVSICLKLGYPNRKGCIIMFYGLYVCEDDICANIKENLQSAIDKEYWNWFDWREYWVFYVCPLFYCANIKDTHIQSNSKNERKRFVASHWIKFCLVLMTDWPYF